MFRHDTSHDRNLLSLLSAGHPTRNPISFGKGVCWQGRGEGILSHPFFRVCASCGQEVNASYLSFPSKALEQDEAIKARCQRIVTVSLLRKLQAQMLLFSASGLLIHIHNTSITAHLVLLIINQFFSVHECFSNTEDTEVKEKMTVYAQYIFQVYWLVDTKQNQMFCCSLHNWRFEFDGEVLICHLFEVKDQFHLCSILGLLFC